MGIVLPPNSRSPRHGVSRPTERGRMRKPPALVAPRRKLEPSRRPPLCPWEPIFLRPIGGADLS